LFEQLEKINNPPEPFEFYTAADLWTDDYTSEQMLKFHLDEGIDASSRNIAFIDQSVDWIASHFDIGTGKKVADFGCGSGLYATRLAKRHAEVTGIDFSKRSIQYAQEAAARERLSNIPASGAFNPNTPMPPGEYIDVGMTAHATHKSDCIIIKITKVENKFAEGIVTQIIPKNKKETKTDLAVGDKVLINRFDIDHLLQ